MQVDGRRIVVTGATSGIGRAVATELAARGALVVATGRDEQALSRLAVTPGIRTVAADLTDRQGRRAVLEAAGEIDALVNNAGVGWVGLVADMPHEEIDRTLAVNVLALIHLTADVIGRLRPGGHIVNVGSVLGYVSSPPLTVYAASKFAVHGFSDGLRRELAGTGLHVTEITPGPISSAFFWRATHRPEAASVPPLPMMPPEAVARAVTGALERPGWPWSRTVAVPRWAALSRLGAVPGVDVAVGALARLARSGLVLRPGAGPARRSPANPAGGLGR